MTAVSDLTDRREQMRREAVAIAQARPDAVLALADTKAQHPTTRPRCSPFSALLHRVAAVITTEDLPPARVTFTLIADVTVDLTGSELVENGVRRWATALGLGPVSEAATTVGGWAATTWSASGFADGAWFSVSGYVLLPTPITDRFGCGIGPAT